ncbi:MAG: glycosyltransferase [Candidatus Omnitrophica bacterium]|nr:glycosyltransferase [Candidatus Omnitrophota bacterium]
MSRLLSEYPPEKIRLFVGSHYDKLAPREGRLPCRRRVFPTTTKTGRFGLGRLKAALDFTLLPAVVCAAGWMAMRDGIRVILSVAHGYSFLAAALLSAVTGKPLVLIVHDDWLAMQGKSFFLGRRVLGRIYIWALRRSAHVYAVSPAMQECLRQLSGLDAELQLPAVDPPADRADGFVHREVDIRAPRIIYAGTFLTPDAFSILIEALKGDFLKERGVVDWRLELYANVDKNLFCRLVPEGDDSRIRLSGWVSQDQLADVLRQADILFLPNSFDQEQKSSVQTLLPTKTADYLRAGKPILVMAPPYSSLYRYAVAHRFAEVVGTHEPAETAKAIWEIISSKQHREILCRKAQELFSLHHDMRAQRSRFYERLKDLAVHRKGPL